MTKIKEDEVKIELHTDRAADEIFIKKDEVDWFISAWNRGASITLKGTNTIAGSNLSKYKAFRIVEEEPKEDK